ncbi:pyridoxal phosphate-dependent transferase [Obelidium mucronatum]|nr:pyridoxal phosphate-dependent transferase [Obelidium mucronatum]
MADLSAFGSPEMKALFCMEEGYTPMNNGSFGAIPKSVQDARTNWLAKIERNPDLFYNYEYYQELDRALEPVARILGLKNVDDIVNSVLKSLKQILRGQGKFPSTKKQKIFIMSSTYTHVYGAVKHTALNDGFEILEMKVHYPISEKDLLKNVEEAVNAEEESGREIVLAVYDAIVSLPSVILPFEQLSSYFRKKGILACVDGAQAIGQIPLDLTKLDADFFISNPHKWLYVPRGCAMLYVKKELQEFMVHPLANTPVQGNWRSAFTWPGTTDVSNFLSASASVAFRESIGGEAAIMNYCHNLAINGGRIVAEKLGTTVLLGTGDLGSRRIGDDYYSAMVNVQLPWTKHISDRGGDSFLGGLKETLMREHKIAIVAFQHGTKCCLVPFEHFVQLETGGRKS